ncbi:peptide chain release factor N(5)-glutamine methyltransferase [Sphingomonas sp. CGMCC 1.13654]|uniref:Release factor glutamine methyltransferase n=1 Tax=Sphingomonas chungangi TaxID=2683589 RepID=A0A838L921_9SPHN|nr:peptide chain release factor N(5)-glutamine methyltransferase [Sphingomonas chungangi]MBA2935262.1 peptide chain release factor N(5)-glutamine methyltransferase [Sphingomonas chungangi]MVW56769.1 peptide chain release factor N(5)-glutamine methyltransferase [Sphingomonas chungangi]
MSPPETIGAAIRAAAVRLTEISETPRLDAELLMAEALGVTREVMLLGGLHLPFVPSEVGGPKAGVALGARVSTSLDTNGVFEALVERRVAGEPIAYILGYRDFWTIRLQVGPGVLIPRPDSETLIEAAVAHFAGMPGPKRILDLGTGSGALLLAALDKWPEATGVGIDRSPQALAIAQSNAEALDMADRAQILAGGWSGTGEAFDLILCNPPYIGTAEPLARDVIDYEPHSALFAGADGLDDYRAIAPLLPAQIVPGGVACIEIGATQGASVASFMASQGLVVHIRHDLAGLDRCLVARRR